MQLKSACASQTAYLLKGESNKEACCCTKLDRRFGIIGRPQITSEYDCTVHISFGNSFASSPPAATITKLGRQSQELDKLIQEREAIEKDIELAKKNEVEEAKQLVDNYETQVLRGASSCDGPVLADHPSLTSDIVEFYRHRLVERAA